MEGVVTLKKIFSVLGVIVFVNLTLVGLLFLIVGIVEEMIVALVLGIIMAVLSIVGCVYCGKSVSKINSTESKEFSGLKKEDDNFNNKNVSKCVICHKEIIGKFYPKAFGGYVCRNCTGVLTKQGFSSFEFGNHSLIKLKRCCGVRESITNPILLNDKLSPIEKLQRLVVSNPHISLATNEECYYQQEATAYKEKNVVTGRKSGGSGVSFRVAKGVYVRTGGGNSQVIRENVGEYFDGMLYITNLRMVLLTPKYGFDIPFSKITRIENHPDGFQIYSGAKCYLVLTIDVSTILAILNLIKIDRERKLPSKENVRNTKAQTSSTDLDVNKLRELKTLFDEGVITEEEFNAKKKRILEL